MPPTQVLTGFARQQFEGFHDGRLEALETMQGGGFRPGGEDAVAQAEYRGESRACRAAVRIA